MLAAPERLLSGYRGWQLASWLAMSTAIVQATWANWYLTVTAKLIIMPAFQWYLGVVR